MSLVSRCRKRAVNPLRRERVPVDLASIRDLQWPVWFWMSLSKGRPSIEVGSGRVNDGRSNVVLRKVRAWEGKPRNVARPTAQRGTGADRLLVPHDARCEEAGAPFQLSITATWHSKTVRAVAQGMSPRSCFGRSGREFLLAGGVRRPQTGVHFRLQ